MHIGCIMVRFFLFDVLPVGNLDVLLVHHGIVQGSVDFHVTKERLYLFDRHAFVDSHRRQCSSEHMGIDPFVDGFFPDLLDSEFNCTYRHTLVWCLEGSKEGSVGVCPGLEIFKEMHFRLGIKVDDSFFVPFSQNGAFPFLKIDVVSIQKHQLSHTHAGREQHVDHGKIPEDRACFSDSFNFFVCNGFLDSLKNFYLVDLAHRTLQYIVFILQPGKESGEDATYVVQCYL